MVFIRILFKDFSQLMLFPISSKFFEPDFWNLFAFGRKQILKEIGFQFFQVVKLTLMKGNKVI